jgi:nucleoside-diphosphate-sugar epimerase
MSSVPENVLVFGATGAVGCAAAIEAHRRGANVWLAMRDTSKTIKGLKEVDLASGRYNRVQADLSVPETVKRVAQQSKAVAAFVYTVFESEDNMRGTFDALKHAGCEHVVILSSYSVKDSPADERNMQYFIESHTTYVLQQQCVMVSGWYTPGKSATGISGRNIRLFITHRCRYNLRCDN